MDYFFSSEFGAVLLWILSAGLVVFMFSVLVGIVRLNSLLNELLDFFASEAYEDWVIVLSERAKQTTTKVDDRAIALLNSLPELVEKLKEKQAQDQAQG